MRIWRRGAEQQKGLCFLLAKRCPLVISWLFLDQICFFFQMLLPKPHACMLLAELLGTLPNTQGPVSVSVRLVLPLPPFHHSTLSKTVSPFSTLTNDSLFPGFFLFSLLSCPPTQPTLLNLTLGCSTRRSQKPGVPLPLSHPRPALPEPWDWSIRRT